jgi:hypothetical protein
MDTHNAETVAVKACCSCGTGLLENDKFCRKCGICQMGYPANSNELYRDSVAVTRSASARVVDVDGDTYHPVSGPLVKAVVAGVSSTATAPLHGRVLKSSILALISVPIWLIIVLLSPIDAYLAARTLSRAI